MRILGMHHVALYTRNLDKLERFYTEKLGLPVVTRWQDSGIVFLRVGDTRLELIGDEDLEGRPHALGRGVGLNHLALQVADVEAAYRELVESGVTPVEPPALYRSMRTAFLADPDGNVLELIEGPAGEAG